MLQCLSLQVGPGSCRLTAVFTPLVARLSGQSPSGREWGACTIALAGGILISLDSALKSADATGDAVLGEGP